MRILHGLLALHVFWWAPALAQNTTNPFQPYDPDVDTLLLYHLEEGSGGVVNSYAPSFDGILLNADWVDGRFDTALQFDGNGRIDVDRSTRLQSPDLTFELWVYQEERDGAAFLMDSVVIQSLNPFGRLLALDESGRAIAMAVRPGSGASQAVSPSPIPLRQWVHLSAIFHESRGVLRLAVNGRVVDSDVLPTEMRATDRLRIASSLFIEDRGFIGLIDEVRVSSVARMLVPVSVSSVSWGEVKGRFGQP